MIHLQTPLDLSIHQKLDYELSFNSIDIYMSCLRIKKLLVKCCVPSIQ